MTLIPTNCWNTDSAEAHPDDGQQDPPPAGLLRSRHDGGLSRASVRSIRSMVISRSFSPSRVERILRASGIAVRGDEVARRLRDGEGEQRRRRTAGHDHREEHPPPRLEAEPQDLAGAAGELREDEVDQQRDEDAGDDGELLERAEPTADPGGRDLGDVGRRDDGRDADPEPADDPEDDERASRFGASPVPIALTKNSTAATFIVEQPAVAVGEAAGRSSRRPPLRAAPRRRRSPAAADGHLELLLRWPRPRR